MKKLFITLAILLLPTMTYAQVLTGNRGGTGLSSGVLGDIGNCLKVLAVSPILTWNIGTCGSGGGGSGGTFSTTTSTVSGQLINYPNNTTDIVVVGASATTTAGAIILNPNTGTSTLQNVIAKSLNNYTVFADQFSGATAGAQLAAATSYICPTGGTVDARGLTGVQTISTASYTLGCLNGKAITYIFGATTYNVVLSTTLLTVYSHVTIIGQASTTFQTSVSAPTATGVGGMFTPYYDATKTGTITAGSKSLTVSDGSYFEPGSLVAIVGAAGGNQYQATTLNFGGGIDNATTSIPFTSTSGVSGANYWLIDSEIITGTVSGNYVIGVTRGALGSSAASHSDGATITWMGDLITRVKSVSGTTITLEDAATQSVTSAPVTVGSTDINFLGSLTLDGRQNRDGADVLTNPTGIFARLASKIHVDPTVNFKNFDHMGVMLQASWDNDLWDSEATGIGRPSDGLGFAFLGFGQSKYNHVHASNVRDSFIGVSFDDRSTTLTEFDGTPQYNEIWLDNYEATSSTARGFGIVLQGAQNTTVHTGHIYAPSDSCITLNSLQWNTIPPVQNNVVYAGSLDCSATVADDANSINNTVYYQRSSGSVSLVGRTKVIQDGSYFLNQQVGIGTSTPIGSLEIASNTPRFYLTDLNAASNNHIYLENLGGKFVLSTTSPTDFSDRSTPLFSFDTSGNFAINNATPAERVDFSNSGSANPNNLKLSSFTYFGSTFSGIAPGLCYNAKVDTTSGVANQFRVANTSSVGFGCLTMTSGGYNFFASSSSSVSANSIITPSTASQFSVSNIGRATFAGDITVSTTTATSTLPRLSVTDYASTSQLMVSGPATSTFTSGVNVKTGCFAVNGTCVGGGGGSGTVTSVDVSGGTTGLTFSGGPVTTSGTITAAGTLGLANGGTNAASFTTSGNALYYNGSALLTAPLTSAITIPYASSTALTVSGYSYLGGTSGANVEIGTTTGISKLNVSVTSGGAVMEADSWDSANFNTVKFYNDKQLGIAFTTYGSAYGFASVDNVGKSSTALYVNGGPFFAGTSILARVDLGVNSTPVITISSSSPSNVGVGTTTPGTTLSVAGVGNFQNTGSTLYSTLTMPSFSATSTTATSTIAGNLMIGTALFNGQLDINSVFGTAVPFQVSGNVNDILKVSYGNTSLGTFAAFCNIYNNANSPRLGIASSYYGGICFAGPNYNIAGFDGLKPNGTALFASDGDLSLGSASTNTASSSIRFFAGRGFGKDNQDAVLMQASGGTNSAFFGLGTSSPYAKFSIHTNNGENGGPLLTVGSSTQTATTTLFTVINNGNVGISTTTPSYPLSVTGKIYSTATTTSPAFEAYSTTATSTFANGINLTGGCLRVNGVCLTSVGGGSGTVTSVDISSSDSSLTVGGGAITTSGTLTALLNVAHINAWTARQTFANASSTLTTLAGTVFDTSTAAGTPGFTLESLGDGVRWVATTTFSSPLSYSAGAVTCTTCLTAVTADSPLSGSGTSASHLVLGTVLVANGGTAATTFGQGWIFSSGGTAALSASTSPTVAWLTATSTTATSTFPRLQVTDRLLIPNANDVTNQVSATGEIAVNTGTSSLNFYANGADNILSPARYLNFSYATSTWTGTTTVFLGASMRAQTLGRTICYTDAGTVNVQVYNGATKMNMLLASSTLGTQYFSSSNVLNMGIKRSVDIGTPATSPKQVSCTIELTYTN